jgi:hypothetical protein
MLNGLMSSIQAFFANIVYPQAAINRAQGLVGVIQGPVHADSGDLPRKRGERHPGQPAAA